ncbi:hypothetical protein D3C76_1634620 [compost metagenome]
MLSRNTLPLRGFRIRDIVFRIVDLPEPLAPTRAVIMPEGMDKFRSSTIRRLS